MQPYEHLLRPLQIGRVTVKNRFAMGPMTLPSQYGPFGEFSADGLAYFEARAKGGFGLLFTGALHPDHEVDPVHPHDSKFPLKAPKAFLRSAWELNERLSVYGTKLFPQISMGLGRNSPGCHAPSAVPSFFQPERAAPALTRDQIKRKVELMVQTAAFLQSCGFEGAEIHAMHWGYLLDEFAMAVTNQRTDAYGGSLENRLRAAREIAQGIKQVCGEGFALSMRLGLKSYMRGFNKASLYGEEEAGRTLEEGVRIAKLLEDYGYDALSVDAGVYDSFYHSAPPCYMPKGHTIDLAAAAKEAVGIPILCGSRMNDMDRAEAALKAGQIDGVVLARAALADPELPQKVEMGRAERIRPCIGCNQNCIGALLAGGRVGCAVNPQAGREAGFGLTPAMKAKEVMVIGGGVAGMEVARTAALRGHHVSLYEASGRLGGCLAAAGAHDFKAELNELNRWYQSELQRLSNVKLHLHTAVTAEDVIRQKPDVAVLSVGAESRMPPIPGIDGPNVMDSVEALSGTRPVGDRVTVIGGGVVGCELAYGFALEGKQVAIVEAKPDILSAGDRVPIMNGQMLRDLLEHHGVTLYRGQAINSISPDGLLMSEQGAGKEPVKLSSDTIVIATGFTPLPSMARALHGSGIAVYEIGDGSRVSNVSAAINSAYTLARSL